MTNDFWTGVFLGLAFAQDNASGFIIFMLISLTIHLTNIGTHKP